MESCKYFLATDNISSNKTLINQFKTSKKFFSTYLQKGILGPEKKFLENFFLIFGCQKFFTTFHLNEKKILRK